MLLSLLFGCCCLSSARDSNRGRSRSRSKSRRVANAEVGAKAPRDQQIRELKQAATLFPSFFLLLLLLNLLKLLNINLRLRLRLDSVRAAAAANREKLFISACPKLVRMSPQAGRCTNPSLVFFPASSSSSKRNEMKLN